MDPLGRRDGDGGGGIGLGWLLAIALGGGILLFAALGFLLVWRLKMRAQPCTTRVYAADDPAAMDEEALGGGPGRSGGRCGPLHSSSTNVLSKKRFLQSDSSMSRLSSRLSLNNMAVWQPPVLPPLPTHNGSFLGPRGRRRSRTWVDDGEAEHGPKIERKSWRESWFGRDSWVALMMMGAPTLPSVGAGDEPDKGDTANDTTQREVEIVGEEELQPQLETGQDERPRNEIQVQKKRQSRPPLMTSKTAPELSRGDDGEPARGRSRVSENSPQKEQPQHLQCQPQTLQQLAPTYDPEQMRVEEEKKQQRELWEQQQKLYQQRVQASATETDLRDILQSTERRLRDGNSRSPVKTPRSSPNKGSPTKTPRSCRTGSSAKTAGRMTPSPSKKSNNGTPTPSPSKTHSHNGSISSIGSAANSLIRAATQELQLPNGLSSPSRSRGGQEWDVSQKDTQQSLQPKPPQPQQQQRPRSKSLDSDASSFLSTLYSVGEPDEEDSAKTLAANHDDDPFVETRRLHQQQSVAKKPSWENRQQLTGPRPLRRTKTLGPESLPVEGLDESAIPAPLRTISVNSHLGRAGRQGMAEKRNSRFSVVLQPPQKTASEEVKPKTVSPEAPKKASLSEAPSDSSMASESAYTDASVGNSSEETIKPDESPMHKRATSSVSSAAATPTKNGRSLDLSSSPLDEREVLSMLMSSTRPKRNLPVPPSQITLNDETVMTTPLSPRPKSKQEPSPSRRGSIASTTSSNYDQESRKSFNPEDDDGDRPNSLPGRPATMNGLGSAFLGAAHSVGSTVAELRRMNSVVSSYSVASVASTIFGDTLAESPTLPSLRGGGFSPSRTNSKNEVAGKRNYLALGTTSPPKDKVSSSGRRQDQQQQSPRQQHFPQQHPPSRHGRIQNRSSIPVRAERKDQSDGKENQEPSSRTVRFTMPSGSGLRGGQNVNLPPPSTSPVRNTGEITAAQVQRASTDSLGLYDKDGFLKNSPDRNAVAKGGRLRM